MKVEGSNITINDSVYNKMSIIPKGACEQDSLPSEYQAVEYIESDGTPYITTSFSGNIYVEGTAQYNDISEASSQILFGQSAGGARWFGGNNGVLKNGSNNFSADPLQKFNFSMLWNFSGLNCANTQVVNSETISRDSFSSSVALDNLSIFKAKTSGGVYENGADAKIYKFTIYSNSTKTNKIGDLVPCYRKSDNVIGMYDLVNGVFYTNQGTGTFAKGNNTSIPNPDYPQDIRVVTGENSVVVSNANAEQSYTLHLGTNYLAGIGDYKDEIVGKTNDWKIRRNIVKVIIDENTNIQTGGTSQEGKLRIIVKQNGLLPSPSNSSKGIALSNYYTLDTPNESYLNIICVAIGASSLGVTDNIFIYDENFNTSETVENFRQWAITNNLVIYSALATPVEETITDTTLINDLNALQDMLSYDGVTNITVTSEDTNAQMEVEVTYTSESDMCEKLLFIFNKMKDKLYHIIRSL